VAVRARGGPRPGALAWPGVWRARETGIVSRALGGGCASGRFVALAVGRGRASQGTHTHKTGTSASPRTRRLARSGGDKTPLAVRGFFFFFSFFNNVYNHGRRFRVSLPCFPMLHNALPAVPEQHASR